MTTRNLEKMPNAALKGLFERNGDVEALAFVRDRVFLKRYTQHPDAKVRVAVARNPYVSQDVLRKLMEDSNRVVYTTAMRHPFAWAGDLVVLGRRIRRTHPLNQQLFDDIKLILMERNIDLEKTLFDAGALN